MSASEKYSAPRTVRPFVLCNISIYAIKHAAAVSRSGALHDRTDHLFLFIIYSSMARAAVLPAPIALMTVDAPVTASPPA